MVDATSTWTSTTTQTWTVPANKRWFLIGLGGSRSVSALIAIKFLEVGGGMMFPLADVAAGTGTWVVPSMLSDNQNHVGGLIMDAGETISLTYGAAQGGAAYHSISVLEIDA